MHIPSRTMEEIVKPVLKVILARMSLNKQIIESISISLISHLREVKSWSARIDLYGMGKAQYTADSTIALDMIVAPRKFLNHMKQCKKVDEMYLLEDNENYLLLGSPGSGKTTTLKRLAHLVLSMTPPSSQDVWQYPIVVRLRRIDHSFPLFMTLARIVGIKYKMKKVERVREVVREHKKWDKFNQKLITEIKRELQSYITNEPYVGDVPLENLISEVLNETHAFLLLDGLDEISTGLRQDLERDIQILASKTPDCKIIVSCRTGEYSPSHKLEGFSILEMCPLDEKQVLTIASKWLDDSGLFLEKLNDTPYQDLLNLPLFLTQLIILYINKGYLPDRPSSVYKQIIRLLLEKWDEERHIKRISHYAHFDTERKLEFLSSLSYHLTYKYKLKYFRTEDLVRIYHDIYLSFDLPKDDARKVAQEIETHTGIIAEGADESYEFSHLSLQEFLCAYYLVREPFARHFIDYLTEYPSPIAVAVSLSSDPSNWFASIILDDIKFGRIDRDSIRRLLSRIIQERPNFGVSHLLGLAMIRLINRFEVESLSFIKYLLETEGGKRSLSLALPYFKVNFEKSNSEYYWLDQSGLYWGDYGFHKPPSGPLHRKHIDMLMKSSFVSLEKLKTPSGEHGRFITIF